MGAYDLLFRSEGTCVVVIFSLFRCCERARSETGFRRCWEIWVRDSELARVLLKESAARNWFKIKRGRGGSSGSCPRAHRVEGCDSSAALNGEFAPITVSFVSKISQKRNFMRFGQLSYIFVE